MTETDTKAIREMGGYFELEHFYGHEYHEGALALDCARNCLAYLFEARHIRKLWVPYYLCGSIDGVCDKYGIEVQKYDIAPDFQPAWDTFKVAADEYLYLVDYYGQLTDGQILRAADRMGGRIVVDEVMAFFHMPVPELDTIYSCRKFFGVADGAYLYTTARIDRDLQTARSFDKMDFVLARAELPSNEYYPQSVANNKRFRNDDISWMSPITHNILRAIDYERIASQREQNFRMMAAAFDATNELKPRAAWGAFYYPYLIRDGERIRKAMQQRKLYISMLWDYALGAPGLADRYTREILPLLIDQRYDADDMRYEIAVLNELR